MKNVQGSIVALVTPFDQDGRIDFNSLGSLLDWHIEQGTDAIVINGTTGEAPTISLDEFDQVTKFCVDRIAHRLPLIAGVGSNNTEEATIKANVAEYNGVDGLLVSNPFYNKPSRRGIIDYYKTIAAASSLPIIVYNVPGRTGSNLDNELIIHLAETIDNISGIKEASGNLDKMMDLIQRRPEGFKIYSGEDSLALATVLLGGNGCISVVANQIPRVFSQMMRAAANSEVDIARSLHYKYFDLMQLNFIESNPIPVKTSLHLMGWIKPYFRSPLCAMENSNAEKLVQELKNLGLTKRKAINEIVLQ